MSGVISKIKSSILSYTNNEIEIDESDDQISLTIHNELYIFSESSDGNHRCTVVLLGKNNRPWEISEDLEKTLNDKLNLEHEGFKLETKKYAHITWQIENIGLEDKVNEILKESPSIAKIFLEKIVEFDEKSVEKNDAKEESNLSKNNNITNIVKSAFDKKSWKYEILETERFHLLTSFQTEKHLDRANDKSIKISVIYDQISNKEEIIFNARNLYKLDGDQSDTIKTNRQLKLGALNLKLTSTYKFITINYDSEDGEIFSEIRIMLDEKQSFSEGQVFRALTILRVTADDYSDYFTRWVLNDDITPSDFLKELFGVKKRVHLESLTDELSENEEIKNLSNQQLLIFIEDMKKMAREKAKLLLDKDVTKG